MISKSLENKSHNRSIYQSLFEIKLLTTYARGGIICCDMLVENDKGYVDKTMNMEADQMKDEKHYVLSSISPKAIGVSME